MLLNENLHEVHSSGIEQTSDFSIKASAKAFKILSDGLYSDKITAVMRELSCNAYDSHIAAGRADIPFEVFMPTELYPEFAVKDTGTGLSHEEVMQLYTTYFESSKTDSNDYVGALGLGSKSPFSYTSSFTVESVFEGVKRIYTAYIGENGAPSISLLSEQDTVEHNGVKVRLPVDINDIPDFQSRVQSVYLWFSVKPEIRRFGGFEWIDLHKDTVKVGDHLIAKPSSSLAVANKGYRYSYQTHITPVQGVVQYNAIQPSVLSNGAQELIESFTKGSVIFLRFPVGSLDIAASRESLSYDKTTIENIEKELWSFYKQVSQDYRKKIESAKTFHECLCIQHDQNDVINQPPFEWKGNHYSVGEFRTFPYYGVNKRIRRNRSHNFISFERLSQGRLRGNKTNQIHFSSGTKYILQTDLSVSKIRNRIKNHYDMSEWSDIVLIMPTSNNPDKPAYSTLKALGSPEYIKDVDLKEPEKKVYSKTGTGVSTNPSLITFKFSIKGYWGNTLYSRAPYASVGDMNTPLLKYYVDVEHECGSRLYKVGGKVVTPNKLNSFLSLVDPLSNNLRSVRRGTGAHVCPVVVGLTSDAKKAYTGKGGALEHLKPLHLAVEKAIKHAEFIVKQSIKAAFSETPSSYFEFGEGESLLVHKRVREDLGLPVETPYSASVRFMERIKPKFPDALSQASSLVGDEFYEGMKKTLTKEVSSLGWVEDKFKQAYENLIQELPVLKVISKMNLDLTNEEVDAILETIKMIRKLKGN